ncbi:MAG: DNA polymerase IV [Tepidiforma sp.]|nr:MAG: DNA polymerase IV [Tepidiforma sp.]
MVASAAILHVDLDAFFVAMELLRRPELRGRPVVVGYLGERGVVSTASYEARRFGIRSAMPTSRARQLCPKAVFIPPDFAYYAPASRRFHAILREFTPLVEPVSVDEAYLDVAGSERLFGPPLQVAEAIRRRIRDEIGITASVGIAANRLVAKVASDAAKPDGLLLIPPGEEAAFLAPRPLRDLPGIGRRTAEILTGLGVRTIGELAALPLAVLEAKLGRHGPELQLRARGIAPGGVTALPPERRSISREHTFERDEPSRGRLLATLLRQAERVAEDLARQQRAARTVVLKLRFPPFETLTRSHTPGRQLLFAEELYAAASALFDAAWDEHGRQPVRLIGLGVTGLAERARQLALGESPAPAALQQAVIDLRERYGDGIIRRAAELPAPGQCPPR